MNRVSKRKRRRIKQGDKIRQRALRTSQEIEEMARLAADMDLTSWAFVPEYTKQLYRIRARQAMSVFSDL